MIVGVGDGELVVVPRVLSSHLPPAWKGWKGNSLETKDVRCPASQSPDPQARTAEPKAEAWRAPAPPSPVLTAASLLRPAFAAGCCVPSPHAQLPSGGF